MRILKLVRKHGPTEAARQIGKSRQHVHQLVRRWAPELLVREKPKKEPKPVKVKKDPRTIVVCFRVTQAEWEQIEKARVSAEDTKLSGREKAREIVLQNLQATGSKRKAA